MYICSCDVYSGSCGLLTCVWGACTSTQGSSWLSCDPRLLEKTPGSGLDVWGSPFLFLCFFPPTSAIEGCALDLLSPENPFVEGRVFNPEPPKISPKDGCTQLRNWSKDKNPIKILSDLHSSIQDTPCRHPPRVWWWINEKKFNSLYQRTSFLQEKVLTLSALPIHTAGLIGLGLKKNYIYYKKKYFIANFMEFWDST